MIQSIKLKNFKCFQNANIELKKLNVFSGINGMGKSTIIQSLLLLKQSYKQGFLPNNVCLNGDYIQLGNGKDVLYENSNEDIIEIQLEQNNKIDIYSMEYNSDADVLKVRKSIKDYCDIQNKEFEYLNAERTAPQVIYPKSSFYVDSLNQLGNKGEYTIHYLLKHQFDPIKLTYKDKSEVSLKEAVQYWLNEISPNIKIDLQDIENTDLAKIGYYFTEKEKTNTFRPTNVGFGISYVLPVIVALIKAKKDSIVIIENPEAHLHPRGQRKMGELIAICSSNFDAQILLETHSEHVLNGIRIAVKNKIIKSTDVKLNFITKEYESGNPIHKIEQPSIQENGKLDYWPDGFFDEWEKALDEIL